MRHRTVRDRAGFTLLEMILSLAIGLIILSALYFLLTSQVNLTQAGRDVLDDGTVARSLLTRMGSDIQGHLGPIDKRVVADVAVTEEEGMASEDDTEEGMTEGATTPATGTSGMSTMSGMSSMTDAAPSEGLLVNIGVQGTESYLILIVGKVNRPGESSAGLRRILHWMTEGGLARREAINVTSAEEYKMRPQDVPDPENWVIAPEVVKVGFEYFDGSSWKTTWDGTVPSGESGNRTGPPSAIRITLTLRKRGSSVSSAGEFATVEFQHVVALPAGNHFPQGEL